MKGMRLWNPVTVVVIILAIAGMLYVLGGAFSRQSISIAGCSAEWSTEPAQVTSDLCPKAGEPCTASPATARHNAIVDAIVCACAGAADGGAYTNAAANAEIERAYNQTFGAGGEVRAICEGGALVRWRY